MGRARRNQRDAIRKQRAKRRRKNDGDDDDYDDDDDEEDYCASEDFNHIHLVNGRRSNTSNSSSNEKEENVPINTGSGPKHLNRSDDSKERNVSEKSTCNQHDVSPCIENKGCIFKKCGDDDVKSNNVKQNGSEEKGNATEEILAQEEHQHPKSEQQKPIRPLDRIERMRLKKQQQKARRKEKRAARESSSSK
ncbi:hypothetical protein ACHAXS_010991 [Conticribra weissflogii]